MAVVLAAVVAACVAQDKETGSIPGARGRAVAPAQDLPTDPRLAENGKLPLKIEVRSAVSMTQEEKDLESRARAAIRQRAALYDLGFDTGDWQQHLLTCPAFPQHLFLRYTRYSGSGDVSMFSASIPRGGNGHIRVIPILRRGYSLISPAPEGKVAMGAFNDIRAEEHAGTTSDWSAVSECYAALTSERWTLAQSDATLATVGLETLQLDAHGVLTVALELDDPAPGRWAITYDRAGRVMKTEYTAFGDLVWRRLPVPSAELKGKPFPSPVDAPQGATIRGGTVPKGKPLPSPSDSPTTPQ
jgi:hypothetical protein